MIDRAGRERLAMAVRAARAERRWTQKEAADRAGLTNKTYGKVEAAVAVADRTIHDMDKIFGWPPGRAMQIALGRLADGSIPGLANEQPEPEPQPTERGSRRRGVLSRFLALGAEARDLGADQKAWEDLNEAIVRLYNSIPENDVERRRATGD